MKRVTSVNVAGACAIAYVVVLAAAIVPSGSSGVLEAQTAADAFAAIAGDRGNAMAGFWLLLAAPFPFLIAGLGLREWLRDQGPAIGMAAVVWVVGTVIALIRNGMWLAMAYEMEPAYTAATGDLQTAIGAVGDTLLLWFTIIGDVLGGATVSIALAVFSRALLHSRRAPRWVAYLGYAVTAMSLATVLTPLVEELMALVILSAPLLMVWMIAVGIAMWRESDQGQTKSSGTTPAAIAASTAR